MGLFNRLVVATLPMVPKPIVRRFAAPYIAGEQLADALDLVRRLQESGYCGTIDLLGEDITDPAEARENGEIYLTILREISERKLDANISVKPTALGLKIDPQLCFEVTSKLIEKAAGFGNFVRFEMEDSTTTTETIEVFRRLRAKHENVGLVLQAYLHRTLEDLKGLMTGGSLNIRLCKGVYVEPESIAYQEQADINASFSRNLEAAFEKGVYVGIATHREDWVAEAKRLIAKHGIPREGYEFQLLLGVRRELRKQLRDEGHRVRVYVPYGRAWYAYSLRRLKKNPKIAGYIVKDMFRGWGGSKKPRN